MNSGKKTRKHREIRSLEELDKELKEIIDDLDKIEDEVLEGMDDDNSNTITDPPASNKVVQSEEEIVHPEEIVKENIQAEQDIIEQAPQIATDMEVDKITKDFSRLMEKSKQTKSMFTKAKEQSVEQSNNDNQLEEEGAKQDYLQSALSKFTKIDDIPKPSEDINQEKEDSLHLDYIKSLQSDKFSLTDKELPKTPELEKIENEPPTSVEVAIEKQVEVATEVTEVIKEPVEDVIPPINEYQVSQSDIQGWKEEIEEKPAITKSMPRISGKKRFTRRMTVGITRFPGTNNEVETFRVLKSFGVTARIIEHYEVDKIADLNGIWIAGGFSYGDVLRAGAIASNSDIMKEIQKTDTPILGVCNGFQILTESRMLPGVLLPNSSTKFICDWVNIKIAENDTFLSPLEGEILRLPIAHFEGNFFVNDIASVSEVTLATYTGVNGEVSQKYNPNGSIQNIAGLGKGRIAAMMPHPERASFNHQGSSDGRRIIEAFLREVKA